MTSQPPTATPQIAPAQRPRGRSHRFASLRTIAALVLREMSTRYGRTPGGYIWSILEPTAAILFLSLGFSLVIRSPSLGTSFLLFYATGYLPFDLYQTISNTTTRALNFSKPLLKYPAVTWIDAILARCILNSLTSILIAFFLLGGVLMVTDSRSVVDMGPILQALVLAIVLGLGVGTVNCVLLGLYPLWDVVWSIITRPLFLASGVSDVFEDLPASYHRTDAKRVLLNLYSAFCQCRLCPSDQFDSVGTRVGSDGALSQSHPESLIGNRTLRAVCVPALFSSPGHLQYLGMGHMGAPPQPVQHRTAHKPQKGAPFACVSAHL